MEDPFLSGPTTPVLYRYGEEMPMEVPGTVGTKMFYPVSGPSSTFDPVNLKEIEIRITGDKQLLDDWYLNFTVTITNPGFAAGDVGFLNGAASIFDYVRVTNGQDSLVEEVNDFGTCSDMLNKFFRSFGSSVQARNQEGLEIDPFDIAVTTGSLTTGQSPGLPRFNDTPFVSILGPNVQPLVPGAVAVAALLTRSYSIPLHALGLVRNGGRGFPLRTGGTEFRILLGLAPAGRAFTTCDFLTGVASGATPITNYTMTKVQLYANLVRPSVSVWNQISNMIDMNEFSVPLTTYKCIQMTIAPAAGSEVQYRIPGSFRSIKAVYVHLRRPCVMNTSECWTQNAGESMGVSNFQIGVQEQRYPSNPILATASYFNTKGAAGTAPSTQTLTGAPGNNIYLNELLKTNGLYLDGQFAGSVSALRWNFPQDNHAAPTASTTAGCQPFVLAVDTQTYRDDGIMSGLNTGTDGFDIYMTLNSVPDATGSSTATVAGTSGSVLMTVFVLCDMELYIRDGLYQGKI